MNLKRLPTNDRRLAKKSGQTLIEVLIAFAVTVIIGVGLVTAGLATQKAATSARNESQATKLAQEYVERLRVMRDTKGWATFKLPLADTAGGDYVINFNSANPSNVQDWTLSGSWTDPVGYCTGNASGSSLLEGQVMSANNVDFCRKVVVSNNSSSATRITFRVEVGWMEGENIKNVRAETILSRWCSAVIDPSITDECND